MGVIRDISQFHRNTIQRHLGVEGALGGVFSVQVTVKTRPEKKSGKRRNDADQNNDGHELDESEAFLVYS